MNEYKLREQVVPNPASMLGEVTVYQIVKCAIDKDDEVVAVFGRKELAIIAVNSINDAMQQ